MASLPPLPLCTSVATLRQMSAAVSTARTIMARSMLTGVAAVELLVDARLIRAVSDETSRAAPSLKWCPGASGSGAGAPITMFHSEPTIGRLPAMPCWYARDWFSCSSCACASSMPRRTMAASVSMN